MTHISFGLDFTAARAVAYEDDVLMLILTGADGTQANIHLNDYPSRSAAIAIINALRPVAYPDSDVLAASVQMQS